MQAAKRDDEVCRVGELMRIDNMRHIDCRDMI